MCNPAAAIATSGSVARRRPWAATISEDALSEDRPTSWLSCWAFRSAASSWTAITAPLAPGVIIAGAGTGKTTVMAARVVWLVGTGQVRPDQVLGLTFTRKAALELGQRVDEALVKAGLVDPDRRCRRGTPADHHLRLVRVPADQRARPADRRRSRPDTDHRRHPLPARRARWWRSGPAKPARPGPVQPATVTERLLKLDAELRTHLVEQTAVVAEDQAFAHGAGRR